MAEKIAGLLCYVLGWLTGLIFFFIDKRPFVRFHAAQSIVVLAACRSFKWCSPECSWPACGWAGSERYRSVGYC